MTPTPPDSPPEGWAEGSQERTEVPQDGYDAMSPAELDKALQEAQERTRAIHAREDAEAEARALAFQISLAAALPTPEQILASIAEEEKIEKERARRRAERAPELRRIKEESWVTRCQGAHARFADATIDLLDPVTREKVDDWIDNPSPGTLLFVGGVGTGKSYAAFAVMREMFLHNMNVKFWPVPKLLDALRPNSGENVANEATMIDVLTLDDMGAERPTEWSMERLYILINDRWMAKRRTILTTNLDGKTLRESIGDRMYSRLIDGGHVVAMGMTDRRMA